MGSEPRVAAVDDVPEDGSFLFTVRADDGTETEAILVRADGGVVGWLNHCQHYTHVRLDKGSGATTRDGEIVCTNHGAMFEADTGLCTYGPCEGAYLDAIEVSVRDGGVHLDDPEYEFVAVGPVEDDDFDLTSRSNLEF